MEMTRFEKFFVNRERKGLGNLKRLRRALKTVDIRKIRDVLEIGCGIGTASARLADAYGWTVSGTDYDARQIEEARRRYPESGGLQYRCEDATRMSFAAASFDLAIAQMVFHHIPAWREAVTELGRVVRPGGAVFCQDFVVSSGLARRLRPLVRYFGVCSAEAIDDAFAAAGFSICRAGQVGALGVSFSDRLYRRR